MKKQYHSTKSKQTNKKVRVKLDFKDDSIMKIKWKSPNDNKQNTVDFNVDFSKDDFIKMKDNH